MSTIQKLIEGIKANPAYAGYDFTGLNAAVNQATSCDIICVNGHKYSNSIGKLKNGPLCNTCSRSCLKDTDIEKLRSYRDCEENPYDFTPQNGETWVLAAGVGNSPRKTDTIHILCDVHGIVEVILSELLRKDGNVRVCSGCNAVRYRQARGRDPEEYFATVKRIHANPDGTPLYDYSKSVYVTANNNMIIICKIHGEFSQKAKVHERGSGCQECANKTVHDKIRSCREEFIVESQKAHKNADGTPKFDYRKAYINPLTEQEEYTNVNEKVCIICPIHGEFWQVAFDHKYGKRGCTYCSESEGEEIVWRYLKDHQIQYEREKTFDDMKHIGKLRIDFYLPNFNAAVEFNGEQHYLASSNRGGIEELIKCQERDTIKYQYCEDNDITLLVIKYDEDVNKKLDEFMMKLYDKQEI